MVWPVVSPIYLTRRKNRRETAFPEEFYSFLYPYCANLSDPSFAHGTQKHHVLLAANPRPLVTDCDARIELIYNDFSMILKTAGVFMSKGKAVH